MLLQRFQYNRSQGLLAGLAFQAGLFQRFLGGGLVGFRPFIGQPLGITQRPVSRDVASSTSCPFELAEGRAANCTREADPGSWD